MSRRHEIGERIKVMRMSRGMSQGDLAFMLGLAQSTVAMWETGKRLPDIETIDHIADVFNVSPFSISYSEQEIAQMINYSDEERHLVAVYRSADPIYRKIVLELLEGHPAKEKEHLA